MEENKARGEYEKPCVKVVVISTDDVMSTSGEGDRLPKDYFGF